jgi:hypothetical protein
MENRNVILILVAIIAILAILVGFMASQSFAREDSMLVIENKNISPGDSLLVRLTDSAGNPISNDTIHIKCTDKDGVTVEKDAATNVYGKAKFRIDEVGTYSVECGFGGNSQYASSSVKGNVEVEKATTEVVSQEKTNNFDSVSGLSGDGYSYYPESGPAVDSMGMTREEAVAKNWHYIPQTIDGQDAGVYVPYDYKANCYHT